MTKPRILVIAPWPPYPWDGGSKRIHSLCRFLGNRFQFSLLTFLPRALERDLRRAAGYLYQENIYLRPVFQKIYWVDQSGEGGLESEDGVPLPEDVRGFYSSRMRDRLVQLVDGKQVDLAHIEFDLMAPYARFLEGVPAVWTQHDAGTISFFRSYFREMAGLKKFLRISEWRRRVRFEKLAGSWFNRVVVTTEPDRLQLGRILPSDKIAVVPTGVDLEHFRPTTDSRLPIPDSLVYVGHYPHYPNEDAVLYFCRDILPRIRARRPGVRLSIVGSSPPESVRGLARRHPGVAVTGTVPDVKPYLESCSVFVAPIRLGQGIKGKILEALAMELPVVATSRACEGLSVVGGRDLAVADRPADFADQVARILETPRIARDLGRRGRSAVERHYDWRILAQRLGDIYEELLNPTADYRLPSPDYRLPTTGYI